MGDMFNEHYLWASLIWGSVGFGYLVYSGIFPRARRLGAELKIVPLIGGLAMVASSYLVDSWFWMSLACIALMFGVWFLVKQGH